MQSLHRLRLAQSALRGKPKTYHSSLNFHTYRKTPFISQKSVSLLPKISPLSSTLWKRSFANENEKKTEPTPILQLESGKEATLFYNSTTNAMWLFGTLGAVGIVWLLEHFMGRKELENRLMKLRDGKLLWTPTEQLWFETISFTAPSVFPEQVYNEEEMGRTFLRLMGLAAVVPVGAWEENYKDIEHRITGVRSLKHLAGRESVARIILEELPLDRLLRPLLFDEKLRREGKKDPPSYFEGTPLGERWEELKNKTKERKAIRQTKYFERKREREKNFSLVELLKDSPFALRETLYTLFPKMESIVDSFADGRDFVLAKGWVTGEKLQVETKKFFKTLSKQMWSDAVTDAKQLINWIGYKLNLSEVSDPELKERIYQIPDLRARYERRWYHFLAHLVRETRRHNYELPYEVAGLLESLSRYPDLVPLLVKEENLMLFLHLSRYEDPLVQSRMTSFFANAAQVESVRDFLGPMLSGLYSVHRKTTDEFTRNQAGLALKLLLSHKTNDERMTKIQNQAREQLSEASLKKIETSHVVSSDNNLQVYSMAYVLGSCWGALRAFMESKAFALPPNYLKNFVMRQAPRAGFGCMLLTYLLHLNSSMWNGLVENDPVFTENDYQMRWAYTYDVAGLGLLGFTLTGFLKLRFCVFPTALLLAFMPRTGYGLLGLRNPPEPPPSDVLLPDAPHDENLASTRLYPSSIVNMRYFGKFETIDYNGIVFSDSFKEVKKSQERLKKMIEARKLKSDQELQQEYDDHLNVLKEFRERRQERLNKANFYDKNQ